MGALTDATIEGAFGDKNPEIILKKIDRYKKWEKIAKETGLTNEEAVVAVKFLDEIKKRFRPEAKGEKPRDYIESFRKILRDYNITLTLGDMNSLDNFPVKNLSIKNGSEKTIKENKKKRKELKENIERLVKRDITSIDKIVENLSETYREDEDWKKYLVQKNIRKREIAECLKTYPKDPKYFLKHHTLPKRILKRALYRELLEMAKEKEEKEREEGKIPVKSLITEIEKGDKPTELPTTDKIFYGIIKDLKKKDLGE